MTALELALEHEARPHNTGSRVSTVFVEYGPRRVATCTSSWPLSVIFTREAIARRCW